MNATLCPQGWTGRFDLISGGRTTSIACPINENLRNWVCLSVVLANAVTFFLGLRMVAYYRIRVKRALPESRGHAESHAPSLFAAFVAARSMCGIVTFSVLLMLESPATSVVALLFWAIYLVSLVSESCIQIYASVRAARSTCLPCCHSIYLAHLCSHAFVSALLSMTELARGDVGRSDQPLEAPHFFAKS